MTTLSGFTLAAATLGAALCMAGCGHVQAYEGARLPKADRAVVRADPSVSAGLPVQVILRKVDEYEVPVSKTAVELQPGRHRFLVDCRVPEAGVVTIRDRGRGGGGRLLPAGGGRHQPRLPRGGPPLVQVRCRKRETRLGALFRLASYNARP
jgi:hypothetical protein